MNLMEAADERLMELTAGGDNNALETLMRRYHRPLLSFISRQTDEDAEDIYQETWIRVVRGREKFDPSRKFSAWIFRIAVNLCRDSHRRSAARPQTAPLEDAQAYSPAAPDTDEQADTARKALDSLSPADREIIALRYYQGMKEKEVAEILGIPAGTVKRRTHDAVLRLKKKIKG